LAASHRDGLDRGSTLFGRKSAPLGPCNGRCREPLLAFTAPAPGRTSEKPGGQSPFQPARASLWGAGL